MTVRGAALQDIDMCETCRWWRSIEEHKAGSDFTDGRCMRHAPKPIVIEDYAAERYASWPITASDDRCGEWTMGIR